jgi:hypothetical protein
MEPMQKLLEAIQAEVQQEKNQVPIKEPLTPGLLKAMAIIENYVATCKNKQYEVQQSNGQWQTIANFQHLHYFTISGFNVRRKKDA